MASYIALLRKEKKSDYGVYFPDFPGCITAGSSLDEARIMAKEALDFHVEGLLQDGERIPAPSTLDDIMAKEKNRDALPFLVDLTMPSKVVRINITARLSDLDVIDAAAAATGTPRSTYLISAAVEKAHAVAPPLEFRTRAAVPEEDGKKYAARPHLRKKVEPGRGRSKTGTSARIPK